VNESEPNGSLSDADAVEVEDVAVGTIDPAGDQDFYWFTVGEGTTLEIDVAARRIGSPLDPVLRLWSPAGSMVAYNDDHYGLDSRIVYEVPRSGVYAVSVAGFGGEGGPGYHYRLNLGVVAPGPGDPTTIFATGFTGPWGLAAGPEGRLFVADLVRSRLQVVGSDGEVNTLAENVEGLFDIAIDGDGRLLATLLTGSVVEFDPETGAMETFINGLTRPTAFAVGLDGSLWVAESEGFTSFDRSGERIERLERSESEGETVISMAVSPAGALHYTTERQRVYRVDETEDHTVIESGGVLEGLAFDQDGYLYVADGMGRVDLYDPSYALAVPVVARSNLGGPSNLVFLRDSEGHMTSRLLVSNWGRGLEPPYRGGIVELDLEGVRAPGFLAGLDYLRISGAEAEAVMGAPFAHQLEAEAGVSGVSWQLEGGELPPGLTLIAGTGLVEGIPEEAGSWTFRIRAEADGRVGRARITVTVLEPVVTVASIANHLLGVVGALTVDHERYLDLRGNRNGRLDVGDYLLFRAGGASTVSLLEPIGREE
jgi:sugar lactone lactonase YvrE